jgi:hypothetical protein
MRMEQVQVGGSSLYLLCASALFFEHVLLKIQTHDWIETHTCCIPPNLFPFHLKKKSENLGNLDA